MEWIDKSPWDFCSFLIFTLFSLHASVVDIKKFQIPDFSITAGTVLLLVLHLFLIHDGIIRPVTELLCGGFIFFIARGVTRGKLGFGDVKFAAFMGVFIGFPGWFAAAALGSLLGLLFILGGIIRGRLDKDSPIPFAPFLTVGSIAVWLAGVLGSTW